MARKDALTKLYSQLIKQRDVLRKSLLGDLADLGNESAEHGAFDDGDQAFEAQQNETIAQLAQIESDELRKIDVALSKIREGTYGTCDGCQIKIPVARLNALPFSSLCIKCQSKSERPASRRIGTTKGGWPKNYEPDDRRIEMNGN